MPEGIGRKKTITGGEGVSSEIEFSLVCDIHNNVLAHAPGLAALGARFPYAIDQGYGIIFNFDIDLFCLPEYY